MGRPVAAGAQADRISRGIHGRPDTAGRGRSAGTARPSHAGIRQALGDPSKLVQRTAAWALRQSYSRHSETPSEFFKSAGFPGRPHALGRDARVRRALRAVGTRPEMAGALVKLVNDPDHHPDERDQRHVAATVLDSGHPVRAQIEDTMLAQSRSRSRTGSQATWTTQSTTWRTKTSGICTTTGWRCWPVPKIGSARNAVAWR